MTRFLVYSGRTKRTYLCVVAARDKVHALKVARQMFNLTKKAFAMEEGPMERQWNM
jgi:hypothetical protein